MTVVPEVEPVLIRKFQKEDATQASRIIEKGFRINNAQYYGERSIDEQVAANSPNNLIEKAKKVNYFVAFENGRILGIGGYDHEKVHTLFVDPEWQGKGVGTRILKRILFEAKKEGITILDAWSTFNAENFYSNAGFERIERFTLKCQNSSIDFIRMRKRV